MHARTRLAAALLVPALTLVGCSGGGAQPGAPGAPDTAAAPSSSRPTPGQTMDKTAFLAATQKAMLDAKTYAMHTEMTTNDQKVRMEGVGDVSDPAAPKAKVTMSPEGKGAGASASPAPGIEMILVSDAMYMKMPGEAVGGGKYVKVPLSTLSQMGGEDFTKLLNPAESLKMSEQAITQIVYSGEEKEGETTLRKYAVTLDPTKLSGASPSATPAPSAAPSPSATPTTYDIWIDDASRMRKMDMKVDGGRMLSRIDKFGEPVSITAPPGNEVTEMPSSAPN